MTELQNGDEVDIIRSDAQVPPRFVALAKSRPKDANSPTYPGVTFTRLQMEAYPDIRPVVVARSAAETFEVLEETVRRLRWDVVATEAPQPRRGGHRRRRSEDARDRQPPAS
mgnify:CR=1 FL=1